MRVVMVGPDPKMAGGMARMAANLAAAGFFTPRDGAPISVSYFPSVEQGSLVHRGAFTVRRWAAFAVERLGSGAIVHLHVASGTSFLRKSVYALLGRLKGARVIVQIHPQGFADYYQGASPPIRALVRLVLRRARCILVFSRRMEEWLSSIGVATPVEIVGNPIVLDRALPWRGSDGGPNASEGIVLFAGTLTRAKGVLDLLAASRLLHGGGQPHRLVLAGSGGDPDVLAALAAYRENHALDELGWLPPAEMASTLAAADLLVLPSHREGLPMVVLEAMASGVPLVLSPVGALPELLVHERNAVFVPAGDPAALSEALSRLLRDDALRRRMSVANREDARAFDARTVAAQLEDLYRRMLEER